MVRIVNREYQGLMEIKPATPRGCGVLLLIIGLGILVLSFAQMKVKAVKWYEEEFFQMLMAGAGLLLLGFIVAFAGSGTIIDRTQKKAVKWYGVLLPIIRQTFALEQYKMITLEKFVGDSDSPDTYPVKITAGDDRSAITLSNGRYYNEARRVAEAAAKFIEFPLHDDTSGETVVREPAAIDESLRDRGRRTGQSVTLPEYPPDLRSTISMDLDGTVIEFARADKSILDFLPLAIPLIVIILFWLTGIVEEFNKNILVNSLIWGLLVFLFGLLPTSFALRYVIRKRTAHFRVVVSPDALRLEEESFVDLTKKTALPASEIEELVVLKGPSAADFIDMAYDEKRLGQKDSGVRIGREQAAEALKVSMNLRLKLGGIRQTRGIMARSDKATLIFGQGLPLPELNYLHAVIMQKLTQ